MSTESVDARTLVLRHATVVDGTGAPAVRADVVIRDGVVADVCEPGRAAGEVVDLDGLTLAPGFIDIHTHYDAQILWDPMLSPSPTHGVTTAVMGNCGFGVAPARPVDRDLLLGVLELVEDMAPEALAAGVRWDFESFPEYLDCIDATPTAINVAAFVGHTPVRIEAMGSESMEREATPAELDRMCHVVAEARQAGAWGLATSLGSNHVGPGGRHVPSYVGGIDEVAALVAAMGSGVVEVTRGRTPVADLRRLVSPAVTVSWSSLLSDRPGSSTDPAALLETSACGDGAVWPQISCRPINVRVMLANPIALATLSCFRTVLAAPEVERAALFGDPEWRRTAKAEMDASWDPMWAAAVALKGGVDDPCLGVRVGEVARDRGLAPFDAFIDVALELGLDTRFDIPAANLDEEGVGGLLGDPRTIVGLSDAGAHANQQCDASFATHLLGHWVRERKTLTLEQAVWRLTGQPAAVYGFAGRGAIRRGSAADLTAFDPATIGAGPLELLKDLPGGASRLTSRSSGIAHVWVAGTEVVRDGRYVGDTPGRLLRRELQVA